jgi:hypothetical protein
MKPCLDIARVALTMPTTAPAFSQDHNALIGSWRMTSLQFANPDGRMVEEAMNPDPNAAPAPYTANGCEARDVPARPGGRAFPAWP